MKVKELIEELNKFPDEYEVITEGCDCFGEVERLEIFEEYGGKLKVLLMRPEKKYENNN